MTLKPSKPKKKTTKTKKTTSLRKREESILAKLEKALAESSATTTYLNSIINAVADPIFVKDRQHRWVFLNNAYCRLKGRSRDELIGKSMYDIDPKNEADVMWQDDEIVFNFGTEHVREGERTDSKGIVHITVTKKTLYKNEKGEDFIVGVVRDITERQKTEVALKLNAQRTQALLKLNHMTDASLQQITDYALEEAVLLTQSKIGYLAFLNEDESILAMHSWSKSAMEECAVRDKPILYKVEETGLWGEAVRQRRPIITNDYTAPNPLKKGHPPGHVKVNRHMNLPVFVGKHIVLVAGVGNKATDYNEDDVEQLTLLMKGMWWLIDRMRTLEALYDSEKKYHSLFEESKDAIWASTPEGRYLDVNPALVEMYGYASKEEMLTLDINTDIYVNPEARKVYLQLLKEKGFVKDYEQHFKRKDGKRLTILTTTTTVRNKQGDIVAYRGINHDITERKQAEKALWESRNLLQTVLDTIPARVFWKDLDLRYLGCNQPFARDAGVHSPAEMIGKDDYQMGWREQADLYRSDDRQVLESGKPKINYEEPETTPDGWRIWLRTNKVPLHHADGTIWGVLGTYEDITERKQAEEALHEQNALINTILDASPTAIYAMDKEGIVLSWNKAAERIFGGSKEETIGRLLPYVPEEKLEEFRVNLNKILSGEPFLGMELLRRKKDGSLINISMSAAPLYDSSGAVKGIMAIASDITQQKKLEAEHAALENQLRQAQKMEAIGQLGGGVAHDFNNILSAIVGYSHLSLMKMSPGDPNRYNIEQILASSERATALTQRLLAFSRKQTVNLARVNLNDIIANFEKFLLHLLREDIELKTTLINRELPVMADRGQMEQVLMNLVANSRDAMPQGGRIIIETGLIKLDQSFIEAHGFGQEGDYALISVTDTGIGIPETVQDKIFEPFFTTKEEGKGTGLGLSVVYGIVKKHEGYIDVYSQPGIDTTFKIYLPVAREAAEAEKQEADVQNSVRGGTETVLIAEDDASLRPLTANLLRHFGYTVIEAEDGLDAVAKFSENRDSIRLVILDGIMPKMNGKEAWKEIKAFSTGVKAIFISGYAEDIFTKDGIPDREASFIQKPSHPSVLAKRVREVLDK